MIRLKKALVDLSLIVGGGFAAEKVIIPYVKINTGMVKKSEYEWNGLTYDSVKKNEKKDVVLEKPKPKPKPKPVYSKPQNHYSYENPKTPKETIQNKPSQIYVDKYKKYWNEWNDWGGDIHNKVGKWLVKYIIDRYYKQKSPLTAANFWTMFEEKLLKLRYGNEEIKKRRFYDIMETYFYYFKTEEE